jgi:hypothetical protein
MHFTRGSIYPGDGKRVVDDNGEIALVRLDRRKAPIHCLGVVISLQGGNIILTVSPASTEAKPSDRSEEFPSDGCTISQYHASLSPKALKCSPGVLADSM